VNNLIHGIKKKFHGGFLTIYPNSVIFTNRAWEIRWNFIDHISVFIAK